MAINKDFAKRRAVSKKSQGRAIGSPRKILWAIGMLSLVVAACFLFQNQTLRTFFSTRMTHFKAWLAERKQVVPQNKLKAKVVNAKEEEPIVHFEFYTALPNMSMAKAEKTVSAPNLKTQVKVSSADDLERELAEQIQAKSTKREKNENI